MNIAFMDIYGDYYLQDRVFASENAAIGENLLLPIIILRDRLKELGHEFHTIDMYDMKQIDKVVFQDIPRSIYTVGSFKELASYWIRRRWRKDTFAKCVKNIPTKDRILIITEPPVVSERSYDIRLHRYFGTIAAWNTDYVDRYGYIQSFYPQPVPGELYQKKFSEKKLCVMICGNKTSKAKHELYSERRKFIDYFEGNERDFDLYGVGWEKEHLKNYKGKTEHKLKTLSNYKFSICYENMSNVRGYITEKIFDCFFSGVVPVYWGAKDITRYIPKDCFIDRRDFNNEEEIHHFMKEMEESRYNAYIEAAGLFLKSDTFQKCFSVEAYVDRMVGMILGDVK